jgi:hypothetical protein
LAGSSSVTLGNGTVLSWNGPVVELKLVWDDLNKIKALPALATAKANTFISLSAGAIQDLSVAPNPILEFNDCEGSLISSFGDDTTQPTLDAWTLSMSDEYLELSFSETINLTTFDLTQLVLSSESGVKEYTLTVGNVSSVSYTIVRVGLFDVDLNLIKLLDSVAKTQSDSNLHFESSLVKDMVENVVVSTVSAPIEADKWYVDNIKPSIVSFEIDLTQEQIVVTFTEAVRLSSFRTDAMLLHSSSGASAPSVRLSAPLESVSVSSNGTILVINLTFFDLNQIKLTPSLAISKPTTRVSANSSLLSDMQGNLFKEISDDGNEKIADAFTDDQIPPELKKFSLDMTAEQLHLTFSEAVSALSLNQSSLTVQDSTQAFRSNSTGAPDYAFRLTGGTVVSEDSHIVTLNLTTCDMDNLKRLDGVANSTSNTFLRIDGGGIVDLNPTANGVVTVTDGSAIQAEQFLRDSTKPQLVSYRVIMSELGPPLKIILRFSETVDANSLDLTKLVLQDASDSDGNHIRLTKGAARPLPPTCNTN